MGAQGNNYAYNSDCCAENEEASPWDPFHVQQGFEPSESTASVFSGCLNTLFALGAREKTWHQQVRNRLQALEPVSPSAPLFVLSPIAAREFVERGGFDTKDKLIDWIYENATLPAEEYWDHQNARAFLHPRAVLLGIEPLASKLSAAPAELVHMFDRRLHSVFGDLEPRLLERLADFEAAISPLYPGRGSAGLDRIC